jgi:hypothetical protein
MHGRSRLTTMALIGGLALGPAAAQDRVPRSGDVREEGVPHVPPYEPEFRTADELLSALEEADRGLVSLTAAVQYDRTAVIQNDHQTYRGRLYFVTGNDAKKDAGERPSGRPGAAAGSQRKFAIHFDTRITDEVIRPEESTYIFDGEWLVEKNAKERLFIKRQIVPPGESFDPLRIGDGPMPLPIGQKKEDILARYTAELLEPTRGLEPPEDPLPEEVAEANSLASFVRGSYQVRLIPRPEIADEEFREIRLWYFPSNEGNLLPRMARTVSKSGDLSLVRLLDVQVQMQGAQLNRDAQVPREVLDTTVPREGWHVQITNWRGQVGAAPEQGGR